MKSKVWNFKLISFLIIKQYSDYSFIFFLLSDQYLLHLQQMLIPQCKFPISASPQKYKACYVFPYTRYIDLILEQRRKVLKSPLPQPTHFPHTISHTSTRKYWNQQFVTRITINVLHTDEKVNEDKYTRLTFNLNENQYQFHGKRLRVLVTAKARIPHATF